MRRCGHAALLCAVGIFLLSGSDVFAAPKKKPAPKPPMAIPAGKPEIFALTLRGVERGVVTKIKLTGTNLVGLTGLNFQNPKLHGSFVAEPEPTTTEAWIEITAATNLARGPYEVSVKNTNAESSKLKIFVDDLPQVFETAGDATPAKAKLKPPFSFWGTLNPPGDVDIVELEARRGDALVFDVAAKSIGSPAGLLLTLFDEHNNLIASNSGLDGGDPLLTVTIPKTGRYRLQIGEKMGGGSRDHFYRVSVGSFPVVTGCYPLGIRTNTETSVQLIGFNLPPHATALVKASPAGEVEVPVDVEKYRSRRPLKIVVSSRPQLLESGTNSSPRDAMLIPVPSAVSGRLIPTVAKKGSAADPRATESDYYKFRAAPGKVLVIETDAARHGSPMDTKIEILHPDGTPVQRLVLQAVRDSHLTFRNIDSNTDDLRVENWQEMELNQFMYLQGEVCKIFRMPQGPDSGFQFYSAGGRRVLYFDTSPVAHALDEPIYIVEPHPPGTPLVANGLPVFPIFYASDDDALRKLGTDSRLYFTVPPAGTNVSGADGDEAAYLVRVTDTRGFSGERLTYRLAIREAKPDFKVTLGGANPTVNAGSGREFSVTAERIDGFDGDIIVQITNVPSGFFVSTPITIESGHSVARGVIWAATNAVSQAETNMSTIAVTATADVPAKPSWPGAAPESSPISMHPVTRDVNSLGKIKVAEKPKLFVGLEPYDERETNLVRRAVTDKPLEITIAPGRSVPAWLKIERNGHEELVTFSVENLPHGVIVDNIGLNGVLIPKGASARQIFLSAAKWVPDCDSYCFAKSAQVENQTSFPLLLHVRKGGAQASLQNP